MARINPKRIVVDHYREQRKALLSPVEAAFLIGCAFGAAVVATFPLIVEVLS